MKINDGGLDLNNPAFPLLQDIESYYGRTSANGNAVGTTFVCADLDNHAPYIGGIVKILSGPAAGQSRIITAKAAGGICSIDPLSPFTSATGAAQQIAAGIPFVILSLGDPSLAALLRSVSSGPTQQLLEAWQNEAGIDLAVWTPTNPATGGAWARGAVGELLMAYASPNANENARLRSNMRWVVSPTLYAVNHIFRRFVLEFEFHVVGGANLDNAAFFMGLTPGIADTRVTANIMGWALIGAGNALQTVTDAGGAETVNTGFGENLVLTNKLKMDISLNSCKFYLNETQVANHITNLPDLPFYLNFYLPTGAGGAATPRIGSIRAWLETIAR